MNGNVTIVGNYSEAKEEETTDSGKSVYKYALTATDKDKKQSWLIETYSKKQMEQVKSLKVGTVLVVRGNLTTSKDKDGNDVIKIINSKLTVLEASNEVGMCDISTTGRLVADPELRKVNEKDCSEFTVACNDGKGGTVYTDVTMWNQQALVMHKNLKKGLLVNVCGSVEIESYTSKVTGKTIARPNIKNADVLFFGQKMDEQVQASK